MITWAPDTINEIFSRVKNIVPLKPDDEGMRNYRNAKHTTQTQILKVPRQLPILKTGKNTMVPQTYDYTYNKRSLPLWRI